MKKGHLFLMASVFVWTLTSAWADPIIKKIYYQKKTALSYPATQDFRFSLWLTEKGGTDPIWSEEKQIKMSDSSVRTYLGEKTTLDRIDFSQQYWVQVDRWEAKTKKWLSVASRDPLGVVPYALYSESSVTLNTDKWLNSDTNTFIGVGAAGAGNLTHGSDNEGWYNTALGHSALYNNTIGHFNTAMGPSALYSNTAGYFNTATGPEALYSNTSGLNNTASGAGALRLNATGSNNTAIGCNAGYFATAGSNNIYIGSGVMGNSGDDNLIRIGSWQTQTYLAGINGASIGTGNPVYVNSNGQLGTGSSSRRFKQDIEDMGEASSRLMNLRPVTFRYKNEIDQEDRTLQYGLIAEEVAEIYPELVQYGKDGKPFAIRYHELAPMLLNEVQKQAEQIEKLTLALDEKDARLQRLEKLLETLQERMAPIGMPNAIPSK